MELRTEEDEKEQKQENSIKEFARNEIQDAIDRVKKKGKAKDSNGIRAEQLKNCSDDTKEKSRQSSTKLRSSSTSHQKAGEKSESKSFTKRVTEKMQVTTGQSVVCQCCTRCLPQYFMLDSPLACTEFATVLYARLAPELHKVQPT